MDSGKKIKIKLEKSRTLWVPDILFPTDFGHGCIGVIPVFKTKKALIEICGNVNAKKITTQGWMVVENAITP